MIESYPPAAETAMKFPITPAAGLAFAYLLVLATLTSCSRNSTGAPAGIPFAQARIIAVGWSADDLQWPGIRGGIELAARQYAPLKVDFRAASASDAATYAAQAADIARARPHVVILQVGRSDEVRYAIDRLTRSGAKVITVGHEVPKVEVFAHIEYDLAEAAGLLGEALGTLPGGGQAYVLLHDRGASDEATRRYQAFAAGAEKHRLIQRLDERNRHESGLPARDLVSQMLARFRNVSLVVTLDAAPWRHDVAGLLGPENRFATLPAGPALWNEMRVGRCAALAGPLDGEAGQAAFRAAVLALSDTRSATARSIIRCELVTRDTLDDFARRYRAAAGMDEAP